MNFCKSDNYYKREKFFFIIFIAALITYGIWTIIVNKNTINNKIFLNTIDDEYLKTDIENALSEVSADYSKIKKFEKIDNWAGGERYRFKYDNDITLIIYCNGGSTVDSINYNQEKIHQRGFESYNINNYVRDLSIINELEILSEDQISRYLNYPSTAKYSNWAAGRYDAIYYIGGKVKSSNAFGVYSTLSFTVGFYLYKENDNTYPRCIYLKIGNNIKLNYVDNYKKEERKTVEPKYPYKSVTTEGINLVSGVLGNFGKEETIDGEKYILYYVDYGNYTAINNGYMATILVESDEMKKNSSGYLECVDTIIYKLKNKGDKIDIVIPEGYHIFLPLNSNVILIKK